MILKSLVPFVLSNGESRKSLDANGLYGQFPYGFSVYQGVREDGKALAGIADGGVFLGCLLIRDEVLLDGIVDVGLREFIEGLLGKGDGAEVGFTDGLPGKEDGAEEGFIDGLLGIEDGV